MSVYHDFDELVSFAVAMMAHGTRDELEIYSLDAVIKAARCYYWIELLYAEKVEDSDIPTELVSDPDVDSGPMFNLVEISLNHLPDDQDSAIVRTVEDMQRHIRHIVVNRDPSEIGKMGPTDIVHAIIESDYAHIAELQKEIQAKLSTMPTFHGLYAAWCRARHDLDHGIAEAA